MVRTRRPGPDGAETTVRARRKPTARSDTVRNCSVATSVEFCLDTSQGDCVPQYFFDFSHGETVRDPVGHDCAGPADVRTEAMHALSEIANESIPKGGDNQAYTVNVRNTRNITVYTATLSFAGIWLGEDIPLPEDPFD